MNDDVIIIGETDEYTVYFYAATGVVEVLNGEGSMHLRMSYEEWKELTTAKYKYTST